MKTPHPTSPTLLSLAAAIAVIAAASNPDSASARRIVKPVPPPSATCGNLRDRVIDLAAQQAIDRRYGQIWRWRTGMRRAESTTAKGGTAGPGHYTKTNNQEQGVDEADTVKTDGKYIYTVHGNEVLILESWPIKSMNVVARYKLGAGVNPRQLLLRGDQLVVLAQVYEQSKVARLSRRPGHWQRPTGFHGTRVTALDISDRSRPRVQASTDIEGWMATARLVGDDVYVVTNGSLRVPDRMARAADWFARRLPAATGSWQAINKLRAAGLPKIRAYLRAKFRRSSMIGAMPRTRSGAGNQMTALRPMYSCNAVHVPQRSQQLGVLTLSHLDLDRPGVVDHTAVFGAGWQIYASTSALYVAMPDYGPSWQYRGRTRIHKFAFGRGEYSRPRFAGSGLVRGQLLNQFSMSEHRGYLRVATTDQNWFRGRDESAEGGNNLFVLAEQYGKLDVVGSITGLARGERIYSARMIGDKGYVVTFRQTDPLFTLDLSNPRDPKVVGELKINGYSSYIHPLGPDKLLTIGRDADSDGRIKGIHLQIFDVSDPARPVRTHHKLMTSLRNSWSAASWDHKAFTYDPVTRTLALPVSSYSDGFSGLVIYAVDGNGGFDELGKVSHVDGQTNRWRAQITRSMIIDDAIVSMSHTGVQVHDLSNLAASTEAIRAVRF